MVLESLTKPGINVKDLTMTEIQNRSNVKFEVKRYIPHDILNIYRENVYSVISSAYRDNNVAGVYELVAANDLKFISENEYKKLIGKSDFKRRTSEILRSRLERHAEELKEDNFPDTTSIFLSLHAEMKDLSVDTDDLFSLSEQQIEAYIHKGILDQMFILPKCANNIVDLLRSHPSALSKLDLNSIMRVEGFWDVFENYQTMFIKTISNPESSFETIADRLTEFTQLAANRKLLSGLTNIEFNLDTPTCETIGKSAEEILSQTTTLRNFVLLFRSFRNMKILTAEKATIDEDGNIKLTERFGGFENNLSPMPIMRNF